MHLIILDDELKEQDNIYESHVEKNVVFEG